MMTELTNTQIDLIEKMFQYFFDVRFKRTRTKEVTNSILFAKMFNTDKETAQFCVDTIVSIGHNKGILKGDHHGYGSWSIVSMDKIKCENFLNAGGFRKYFSDQNSPSSISNIHLGNNYNQVFTGNNNSSIISNGENLKNEINPPNDNTNKTKQRLKVIDLIIGIGGGLTKLIPAVVAFCKSMFQ